MKKAYATPPPRPRGRPKKIRLAPQARPARAAGRLAQSHGLRGYDAVHLAAAIAIADDDVVFVTGDIDLAEAAMTTGLAIAVPADSLNA